MSSIGAGTGRLRQLAAHLSAVCLSMVIAKAVLAIFALAALTYGAALGGLALGQRRLLFPGAYGAGSTLWNRDPPPGVGSFVLEAPDGVRLRALWKPPRPGCGVVVSFHGNASYPEEPARRFSSGIWAEQGWGVLALAYRGYPGSTGRPSEQGLVADGIAAVAEARRRAPGAPLLLHGHSLGAAVAVAVAEREPDHLGLYLEAPFADVATLAQARFPIFPVSLLLADPFVSERRIPHVSGPIVIVHGLADGVVPIREGRRLAAAAPAGTVFDAVPGDHVGILGSRDAIYEPFFRRDRIAGCPRA